MKKHVLNIFKLFSIAIMLLTLASCGTGNGDKRDHNAYNNGKNITEEVKEDHAVCWQSGVLDLIYNVLSKTTQRTHSHMMSGALAVMMIAFSIWFAFRIFLQVGSIKPEDNIGELWKEVLNKFFICFTCGLLASSSTFINFTLEYTVFPVFNAFIEFGSNLLNQNGTVSNLVCKATNSTAKVVESEYFPSSPQKLMGCMVCSVNERLGIAMDFVTDSLFGNGFVRFLMGCILWILLLFVKLGFVFYIVDSLFKFTLMAILLPLLIMSFAFKQTSSWAKKGFLYMIHSSVLICFIGIILSVSIGAVEVMFSKDNASTPAKQETVVSDGNKSQAKEEVVSVSSIIYENVDNHKNAGGSQSNTLGIFFITMMLICFLLVQSVSVAVSVTNSMVGVSVDAKFNQILTQALSLAVGFITGGASSAIRTVFAKQIAGAKEKGGNMMQKIGNKIGGLGKD